MNRQAAESIATIAAKVLSEAGLLSGKETTARRLVTAELLASPPALLADFDALHDQARGGAAAPKVGGR